MGAKSDGLHPSLAYYGLSGLFYLYKLMGAKSDGLHPSLAYYGLAGLFHL